MENNMRSRFLFLFLFMMFLLPSFLSAKSLESANPEGDDLKYGIFYKDNIAFSFEAPDDWVLDNVSGSNYGLPAVFYPADQTWETSSVVVYARAREITEAVKTIEQQVAETVDTFHKNGSAGYNAEFVEKYNIDENHAFDIYYFSGDEWGNYEAGAYIIEGDYINFFVLNSRNKIDFENAIVPFKQLLKSYLLISTKVKIVQ